MATIGAVNYRCVPISPCPGGVTRRPDNGTPLPGSRLRIHSLPSLATDRQIVEDSGVRGLIPCVLRTDHAATAASAGRLPPVERGPCQMTAPLHEPTAEAAPSAAEEAAVATSGAKAVQGRSLGRIAWERL